MIEAVLVEAARHEHPRQLARTGEVLLARLDPDGRAPLDEEAWRRRDVTVTPFADGSAAVRGRLTPQTAEVLRTILDALSAPTPAQDGVPDVRSAGQRRHDALHEVLMHALRSGEVGAGPRNSADGEPPGSAATSGGSPVGGGDSRSGEVAGCEAAGSGSDVAASQASGAGSGVPSTGLVPAIAPKAAAGADASPGGGRGVPVTVLATVTLAELRAGSGIVTTGHGDVWSVPQLLALAGDMAVAPVVLDHRGAVLAFGRTRRLASRAQRLALAARDRGCAFVGCDRPAAWCEAHHVVEWSDGGPTDIDNLCLLCTYHHAHFRAAGWRVIMQDGLPYCVPPRWLDPDQKPVRNTAHRPSEIDLRAPPSRGSP